MSIDLNYVDGEEISGIIKHSTSRRSFLLESAQTTTQCLRQTWDNGLGVIMHLKNAAAFKYQKKETFYDSFDGYSSCEKKQKEIERDRFKRRWSWRKRMRNSSEAIKIIFVVIFQ